MLQNAPMRRVSFESARRAFLLTAALHVTLPAASQQGRQPFMVEPDELARFAQGLRAAVEAQDPARVARFIRFPLRVNQAGRQARFLRADEFLGDYGRIFTPRLRTALLRQDLTHLEQSVGDVALADGMLTVAGVCPDQRCATIAPRVTTVDLHEP